MTTMKNHTRITLSPEVTKHVFNAGPDGELARIWIRYLKGLLVEDGFDLDDVVAPEVRCIELEMAGYPPGIEGLRRFRDASAREMPDQHVHVLYMTVYPERSTLEAVIRCSTSAGKHTSWDVRTLARFEAGLMVERWDRTERALPDACLRGAA